MRYVLYFVIVLISISFSIAGNAGALRCDGVDDFAIMPDMMNDLDPGQAVTIEVWVNLDAYTNLGSAVGGFSGAIALGQSLGANEGKPSMTVSVPGTSSAIGPNDLPLGSWVHLAGTFDGTDIRLYVNGSLVATENHPGTASELTEGRICQFPTASSNFMDGDIDEVRWWNVVRTDAEIAGSYQQVLNGNEPGLVGYWRFEESSGQAILDSSGNGNDGFLGSAAATGSDDPARITDGAPVQGGPIASALPVPTLTAKGIAIVALLLSFIGVLAVRSRMA